MCIEPTWWPGRTAGNGRFRKAFVTLLKDRSRPIADGTDSLHKAGTCVSKTFPAQGPIGPRAVNPRPLPPDTSSQDLQRLADIDLAVSSLDQRSADSGVSIQSVGVYQIGDV